jgi:hypothetical protein
VRLRYDSAKSYDELVAALLADIGKRPVPINDFAAATDTWQSFRTVACHEINAERWSG